MTEEQKENIAVNGNASIIDHDEYQYLKLIKNIIETGWFNRFNVHIQIFKKKKFNLFGFLFRKKAI